MPLTAETASRGLRGAALVAAAALIAGCSSAPHRAPVEERTGTPRANVVAGSPALAAGAEPGRPAASDGSARPGYYTVKPGDTLIRIALDNGQNWKDLVRWNNLENPNVVEVGQSLRVVAPGSDPGAATARPVVSTRVETRPLEPRPAEPRNAPAASAPVLASALPTPPPVAAPAPAAPPATAPRDGDDDISWGWPAAATVATPFDDARNKGLMFRGKAGDPVLAAADGRVVYAGSGLRGYGNLVILKHNATYLTAYAHNQALLVKDDQTVRKGQKIAEMGSSDADAVQLHFEIRRQGRPIDPARLLPAR